MHINHYFEGLMVLNFLLKVLFVWRCSVSHRKTELFCASTTQLSLVTTAWRSNGLVNMSLEAHLLL